MSKAEGPECSRMLEPFLTDEAILSVLASIAVEEAHSVVFELAMSARERGLDIDATALLDVGIFLKSGGLVREAIKLYDWALEQEQAADIYYSKGNALRSLGKRRLAIRAYREAIGLEPEMVDAMNNMALTYIELGNLSAARAWLDKAVVIREDPEHFWNLATVYWQTGESMQVVMAAYAKCLSPIPFNYDVFAEIAVKLFELGDWERSAKFNYVAYMLRTGLLDVSDELVQGVIGMANDPANWSDGRRWG